MATSETRHYMQDLEQELNRHRSTIVTWERQGWLPEGLQFHRDEQNWRYWDDAQLEQAKQWLADPSRRPGPSQSPTAA